MENFEHLKELMEFVGDITHHSSWDRWGNCTCEWTSEIPFKSTEELEEAYQKHKKRQQERREYYQMVKNSFSYLYRGIVKKKYNPLVLSNADIKPFFY